MCVTGQAARRANQAFTRWPFAVRLCGATRQGKVLPGQAVSQTVGIGDMQWPKSSMASLSICFLMRKVAECPPCGATGDFSVWRLSRGCALGIGQRVGAGKGVVCGKGGCTGDPLRKEYSGQFNVRIGRKVHRALAIQAAREGISLNALVACLLAEDVDRLKAALRKSCQGERGYFPLCVPETAEKNEVP